MGLVSPNEAHEKLEIAYLYYTGFLLYLMDIYSQGISTPNTRLKTFCFTIWKNLVIKKSFEFSAPLFKASTYRYSISPLLHLWSPIFPHCIILINLCIDAVFFDRSCYLKHCFRRNLHQRKYSRTSASKGNQVNQVIRYELYKWTTTCSIRQLKVLLVYR